MAYGRWGFRADNKAKEAGGGGGAKTFAQQNKGLEHTRQIACVSGGGAGWVRGETGGDAEEEMPQKEEERDRPGRAWLAVASVWNVNTVPYRPLGREGKGG